jgi:hypothetical protein
LPFEINPTPKKLSIRIKGLIIMFISKAFDIIPTITIIIDIENDLINTDNYSVE